MNSTQKLLVEVPCKGNKLKCGTIMHSILVTSTVAADPPQLENRQHNSQVTLHGRNYKPETNYNLQVTKDYSPWICKNYKHHFGYGTSHTSSIHWYYKARNKTHYAKGSRKADSLWDGLHSPLKAYTFSNSSKTYRCELRGKKPTGLK